MLNKEELREAEPLLAEPFAGGVLWPDDGHIDPQRLSAALAHLVQDRGGRILEGVEVHEIVDRRPDPLLRTSHGTIAASSVVIVAGSWSARLARSVGAAFPLQPAKGYSVTVERPEGTLRRPLLLSEAKVAATPFDGSLRLAGTLELTGFDQTLSERRVDAVLDAGRSYIPRAANGTALCAWTGLRALHRDARVRASGGRRPAHRPAAICAGPVPVVGMRPWRHSDAQGRRAGWPNAALA